MKSIKSTQSTYQDRRARTPTYGSPEDATGARIPALCALALPMLPLRAPALRADLSEVGPQVGRCFSGLGGFVCVSVINMMYWFGGLACEMRAGVARLSRHFACMHQSRLVVGQAYRRPTSPRTPLLAVLSSASCSGAALAPLPPPPASSASAAPVIPLSAAAWVGPCPTLAPSCAASAAPGDAASSPPAASLEAQGSPTPLRACAAASRRRRRARRCRGSRQSWAAGRAACVACTCRRARAAICLHTLSYW